jgi:hypothetical protein
MSAVNPPVLQVLVPQVEVQEVEDPVARSELADQVEAPTTIAREERATLRMFKPVPQTSPFLETEAATDTTQAPGLVVAVEGLDPQAQQPPMVMAEQVDLVMCRT